MKFHDHYATITLKITRLMNFEISYNNNNNKTIFNLTYFNIIHT